MIRRLARVGYIPLMLLGINGVAVWSVTQSAPKLVLLALLAVAVGVSFAAERFIPYHDQWNRDLDGDSLRDALHAFVNESLALISVAAVPVLTAVIPGDGWWPTGWPFVVQLLVAIMVADFGITTVHLASHKIAILWRFHAVHHSVKRFYGFNGLMKHPLHQMLETAVGVAPLLVLGIPLDVATILAFCIAIQLLLQHSNADYRVGPLTLDSGPQRRPPVPPLEVGRHRRRELRSLHPGMGPPLPDLFVRSRPQVHHLRPGDGGPSGLPVGLHAPDGPPIPSRRVLRARGDTVFNPLHPPPGDELIQTRHIRRPRNPNEENVIEKMPAPIRRDLHRLVESETLGMAFFGTAAKRARDESHRAAWSTLCELEVRTNDGVQAFLTRSAVVVAPTQPLAAAAGAAAGLGIRILPDNLSWRLLRQGTSRYLPAFKRLAQHYAGTSEQAFFDYVVKHELAIIDAAEHAERGDIRGLDAVHRLLDTPVPR